MNRWKTSLEVIGILSLVGSLIFVGIQLSQDRDLKTAELLFTMYSERQANLRSEVGENPTDIYAKIYLNSTPVELTDAEIMVLSSHAHMLYIDWQRSAWMESYDIYPERWRDGVGLYAVWDTPFGRRWLKHRLSIGNNLPPEVQANLMGQLDAEPVALIRSNRDYYDYLRGEDYPRPSEG